MNKAKIDLIKQFLRDQANFILKDFDKIFLLKNINTFVDNMCNKFVSNGKVFEEKNNFNLTFEFDGVENFKNYIHLFTLNAYDLDNKYIFEPFTQKLYIYSEGVLYVNFNKVEFKFNAPKSLLLFDIIKHDNSSNNSNSDLSF